MNTPPSLVSLVQGCESEQLHLSGAIQSFGALICIDAVSGRVTHVSANLAAVIGIEATSILGQSRESLDWLATEMFETLPEAPGKSIEFASLLRQPDHKITGRIIRGRGCFLLEIERNDAPKEPISLQNLQSKLLCVPYDDDEVLHYHNLLTRTFRVVTGYDRVMVYRFHEDWSGEVIAEAAAKDMGSYLGLRFPASDIPAIARNLYMLNASRTIPDINSLPVPILSINAAPPDLTWSDLRSVSPVHLEYLNHMGVGASFSVSIRITGRLWGLVACHHSGPRLLCPDQRAACVLLTNAYSLGMTSFFASRRLQTLDSLDRRIDKILEALSLHDDPLDGIARMGDVLMATMDAQGFAMAVGNNVVIAGGGPDLEGMGVIDDWFLNRSLEMVVITDHLWSIFPEQKDMLAAVSGMVAIKAQSRHSGWVRFYWFRPAQLQEVAWAGDPNKPAMEKAGVTMLSPRRSFERWIDIKDGYSRPWSNEEKLTAAKVRNTLLRWL
jgi:light-regulated signal transduction histidine kinase (bacteriophytochrome)